MSGVPDDMVTALALLNAIDDLDGVATITRRYTLRQVAHGADELLRMIDDDPRCAARISDAIGLARVALRVLSERVPASDDVEAAGMSVQRKACGW